MSITAGTDIAASSALVQAEPWNRLSTIRTALNGGSSVSGSDLDRIRGLHFPRPQVFSEVMYGEFQDVYYVSRVGVVDDRELKHRQIIWGECLDHDQRVRVAGASVRIRMPLKCRVHISATISHRIWPVFPYGGTGANPTAYFSLMWGAVGSTPKQVPGAGRHTLRHDPGTLELLAPTVTTANMIGALDSSDTAGSMAPGGEDVEIFVPFIASSSTFFAKDNGATGKSAHRVDVLNTSLVVRVYKNSSS